MTAEDETLAVTMGITILPKGNKCLANMLSDIVLQNTNVTVHGGEVSDHTI